jgi:hypothetical protein
VFGWGRFGGGGLGVLRFVRRRHSAGLILPAGVGFGEWLGRAGSRV